MKTYFNHDPKKILSHPGKKIVFVHVGKCAGETIMHAFKEHLSDEFSLFEMHCFDANQRIDELVKSGESDLLYLVSKRDPVSRYISAFNWDKHNLYLRGTLKNTKFETFYKKFPTINEMLDGLRIGAKEDRDFADEFSRFGHMGMGQSWYTPEDVLARVPLDRTHFLDTTTILEDLIKVLRSLEAVPSLPDWRPQNLKANFKNAYKDATNLFPTRISTVNRAFLEGHILGDMRVYDLLSNASQST